MERAQCLVLGTGPAEREAFVDQADDIHRVFYSGLGRIGLTGHRGLLKTRHEPGSMVRGRRSWTSRPCVAKTVHRALICGCGYTRIITLIDFRSSFRVALPTPPR